jgi:hypothetical protein
MSRKNIIPGYKAFDALDATTTQTQDPETSVVGCDKASYHVTFSTANTGELIVQAKNSKNDSWYDLDFGVPLTVTAETEIILNVNQINFQAMRLVWQPSAGAGTISAVLSSASVGA